MKLIVNYDFEDDIPIPQFGDQLAVNRLTLNQIDCIISRFEVYQVFFTQIYNVMESISVKHYALIPHDIICRITEQIQALIYVRELIYEMLKFIQKDLEFYKQEREKYLARYEGAKRDESERDSEPNT